MLSQWSRTEQNRTEQDRAELSLLNMETIGWRGVGGVAWCSIVCISAAFGALCDNQQYDLLDGWVSIQCTCMHACVRVCACVPRWPWKGVFLLPLV